MADVDDDVSSSSPLLLGVASFAGLACLLLPAAVMATRRRDKAGGGDGRHDDDGGEEVTVDFGGTATTPRPPLPRNATDATSPATTDDGGAAAAASPYSRDDSLAAVLADFEDASSPAKPRTPGSPPDATSSSPAAAPGAEDDELAAVVRGVLEKRRASRRGRVAERAGGGEAGAASSPAARGRRDDDDDDDGEMTPFDQRRDEDAGAADDFLRGPVRSGSPGRRHGGERVDAEAAAPDLERAAPSTGGGVGAAPVPSPASPHYDLPVPFRAPRSSALRLAAPPLLGSLYRALSRNAIVAVVATYAGTTHLCALFLAQHLLWDLASCGPRGLAAASSAMARGALARGTPALAGQHALLASMASLLCVGIAGTLWGLVGGQIFLALGLGDAAAAELISQYSRAILASAFARHVATDPVLGLLGADGHSTFVASVEAFRVVGGVAATVVAVPIMGGGIVEAAWGFGVVDGAAALVASAVPWGLGWTSKFRAAGVCTSVVMAVKSTRSRNDVLSNGAKMALSNLLEFSEIRGLTFFGVYLGYRPVASWAVASTLWDTLTTLAESIGDIAWIRVSSHLSKNNRRTGERCAYRFVAWGMAVSVVMSVLLGTVGYPICGLLSGGHDAEVKALAEELLPFLSIANIAMAAAVLCRAVLGAAPRGRGRGAGAPVSAVLTNAAVWAMSVPFASVFCLVLDFGLAGLAAGAAVGWILSAFVATYHLLLLADWNPRRVGGGDVGKKQPVSEADAVNDEAPDDGAHRGHDDVLPNWSEDLMPAPPPTTTAATTGERRAVAKVSPKRVSPPKGDIASEDRHAERERDDSLTRRVQRVIEQAEGRRQHQPSSNQLQPNSNPANTSPPSNVEDGKLMGGKMAQIVEEQRVSTAGDSSSRRGVPPPPPPPHATGEAGGGARELFPIGDRAPPPREAFTLPSPPPRRDGQRVASDTLATRKTGDEVPKTSSPEKSMVPSFDPYDYGGVDDSNLEYDTEESHSEAAGVPPPRIPPPPPPQSKVQSHSSVDYEDDGDIPLRTGADGINNIRRSMSDAVSFPSQSEIRPDRSVDCNSGIDFETERGDTGPQADANTVHTRNLSEVNSARSVSRTRSNRSFDYLSFDNEEEAGGDIPPQADADTVHVRNFTFNEGTSSFAAAPTQSWTGSNIRSFDDESLEHISISRRAGPESVVIRNLNDAASASVSRTHSTVREEDIPVRADTSTVDAGNLNRAATESLAQSTISNRPKDYEDSEYAQSSVGGGRDEDAGDDDDDEKDADDATENDDDEHDSDSDDDDDRDKRLHRTRTEESSVGDDNETDCTQAAADSDGEDSDDEEAPPASSAGPRILEDGPKVGGGGQQLPSLQPWWATKSTMPNADDSFQQ